MGGIISHANGQVKEFTSWGPAATPDESRRVTLLTALSFGLARPGFGLDRA